MPIVIQRLVTIMLSRVPQFDLNGRITLTSIIPDQLRHPDVSVRVPCRMMERRDRSNLPSLTGTVSTFQSTAGPSTTLLFLVNHNASSDYALVTIKGHPGVIVEVIIH